MEFFYERKIVVYFKDYAIIQHIFSADFCNNCFCLGVGHDSSDFIEYSKAQHN